VEEKEGSTEAILENQETESVSETTDLKHTGELTPLLVEFLGESDSGGSKSQECNIEPKINTDPTITPATSGDGLEIGEMSVNEETLFDSGTESGEDSVTTPENLPTATGAFSFAVSKQHEGAMDALPNKNTSNSSAFAHYGDGKTFASSATAPMNFSTSYPSENPFPFAQPNIEPKPVTTISDTNAELAQQIDSALALLRDSVARDPTFVTERLQAVTGAFATGISNEGKGKELIALIDRLKSTLNENDPTTSGQESKPTEFPVPTGSEVTPIHQMQSARSNEGLMGPPNEMNAYGIAPSVEDSSVPWKLRKARKKSKTRSHTVGVSEEELAEARRYIQETERRQYSMGSQPSVYSDPFPSVRKTSLGSLSNTTSPVFSPVSASSTERKFFPVAPRPFKSSAEIFESLRQQSLDAGSLSDGGGLTGTSSLKLRPLRTVSLDSSYDPSRHFFTPEENVQIAIHKAAIKKQVSAEENRRNRRSSFSSLSVGKDLSLRLPKPFCAPQNEPEEAVPMNKTSDITSTIDSGTMQPPGTTELKQYSPPILSQTEINQEPSSPQSSRFENVQISLKELNTSEYPQLQIAITLKNNGTTPALRQGGSSSNNSSSSISNIMVGPVDSTGIQDATNITNLRRQSNGRESILNTADSGISSTQPFTGSSDDQCKMDTTDSKSIVPYSSKIGRYKSKSERKKRMKRANTIDIPQPPGTYTYTNEDSEMEDEDSDGYATPTATMNTQPGAAKEQKPVKSSYLGTGDRLWMNKFSNLKCSFESSSQGSSPSISPLPSNVSKRPVSESNLTLIQPDGLTSVIGSKPIWATSQQSQLPSQVKNKLQIFEERTNCEIPAPIVTRRQEAKAPTAMSNPNVKIVSQETPVMRSQQQIEQPINMKPDNKVISSPPKVMMGQENKQNTFPGSVVSFMPPKLIPEPAKIVDNYASDSENFGPRKMFRGANSDTEGKRTVHAVAHMFNKKDIIPPSVPPRTHQLPQPPAPEKIELPWAKKEVEDSSRVHLSRSKFEAQSQYNPSPASHTRRPQSAFIPNNNGSQPSLHDDNSSPFIRYDKKFETRRANPPMSAHDINKSHRAVDPYSKGATSFESTQQGRAPKKLISTFGVTRSFDDTYRQPIKPEPLGQKTTLSNEYLATKPVGESRKILKGYKMNSQLPLIFPVRHHPSPPEPEILPSPPVSSNNEDACKPVVSKVMKGPQKQTAMVTTRVASLSGDESKPNRMANARSNIRSILNQYNSDEGSSGDSTDLPPAIVSGNFKLPPLSKSQSGGSVLSQVQAFRELAKDCTVAPLPTNTPSRQQKQTVVKDSSENAKNTNRNTSTSNINSHIPRQKSLSEFPRIAPSAPVLKTITVNTSMKPPGHSLLRKKIFEGVPTKMEDEEFESDLDLLTKPYRTFSRSDQLKRSSSGSTIFNRAQSLYLSAQENIRPVQAERVKSNVPRTQKLFPKQFEAQMSPSSANQKQREVEAYFTAQQEQQKRDAPKGKRGGNHLRKSASLGRLMHRQMSISDGDDDVDQIFESLFKASGTPIPPCL